MSSDKKLIAVDIDDVIADSNETVRLVINNQYGLSLEPKDYNVKGDYWGYYERVWKSHGLELSFDDLISDMTIDQMNVPLLAGASFALTELAKKFDIVIVTSRSPDREESTRKLLKELFVDREIDIYFSKNSQIGTGEHSKGEIANRLGASWLIDDNVEHCLSAQEFGVEPILFGEYGWHHQAPKGLTKCKDWPAVVDYFSDK